MVNTRSPPRAPHRQRILVIEDDFLIALMIEEMVREAGYRVSALPTPLLWRDRNLPSATSMLCLSTSRSVDDPTRKLRTFCWIPACHSHS
jgi:hypothetical protein